MNPEKPRNSKAFIRSCINCIKYKKCNRQPKNKLRWYQEWCGHFDPHYSKIDRKLESRTPGLHTLMRGSDETKGVSFQRIARRLSDEVDRITDSTDAVLNGQERAG
jgi:hypothetical protein